MPELPSPLSFQVIWPENYPRTRVPEALKRQIETHASQVAEENIGDAATYLVYDSVKENLEDWGVLEELLKTETESQTISTLKTQPSQKQYKYIDSSGENLEAGTGLTLFRTSPKRVLACTFR